MVGVSWVGRSRVRVYSSIVSCIVWLRLRRPKAVLAPPGARRHPSWQRCSLRPTSLSTLTLPLFLAQHVNRMVTRRTSQCLTRSCGACCPTLSTTSMRRCQSDRHQSRHRRSQRRRRLSFQLQQSYLVHRSHWHISLQSNKMCRCQQGQFRL